LIPLSEVRFALGDSNHDRDVLEIVGDVSLDI
jgi:hypothetical protein